MCDYPELRSLGLESIRNSMQAQELKTLVEAGDYKPDPSQVAIAMLRRRGVRELLTFSPPSPAQAGRTHLVQGAPRRAA